MKNIKPLTYLDVINNSNKDNINRLPYIQFGSHDMLYDFLPDSNKIDDNLKRIIDDTFSPHILSVNFTQIVPSSDEVYVELYEDTCELVKALLARGITALRHFPKTYISELLNAFLNTDLIHSGSYVDGAEEIKYVVSEILNVKDCEVGNIFDIINMTESDKFKRIFVRVEELLEERKRDLYSFKCSRKEFIELARNEFGQYLRLFTKQIQLSVQRKDMEFCMGVSSASKEILPMFNIAGVTDNFGECIGNTLNLEVPRILQSLSEKDIRCYEKLTSGIMSHCLNEKVEVARDIMYLTIHNLCQELIKKHEFLGADMYNILIEQAIKRF